MTNFSDFAFVLGMTVLLTRLGSNHSGGARQSMSAWDPLASPHFNHCIHGNNTDPLIPRRHVARINADPSCVMFFPSRWLNVHFAWPEKKDCLSVRPSVRPLSNTFRFRSFVQSASDRDALNQSASVSRLSTLAGSRRGV